MSISTTVCAMQNLLVRMFGDKYRDYVTVALNWRNVVGDYLYKHSKVMKIQQDIIFIGVSNSVVMQELILIREDLKQKINRKLSLDIKDIVFYIADGYRDSYKRQTAEYKSN